MKMENIDLNKIIVKPALAHNRVASNLAMNEKIKELISSGREIAHFAFGESPFPVPETLVLQLRKEAEANSYLPMQGIPELRHALKEFHLKYDQLEMDPENFIVSPGSKEIIYLIMNAFNGTILLSSPSWTTYEPQAMSLEKRIVILQSNKDQGWKVTPSVIENAIVSLDSKSKSGLKLLILTNPGNPTGTCYTEEEIKTLSSYCRNHGIVVLCDEIYSRLTFKRNIHYSMLKCYPDGTIMTNGFSKMTSAGGWRLGYCYIPSSMKSLLEAVKNCASHTYSCAPAPMQYAIANFLSENSEELEEYLDECITILKMAGDYCYRELKSVGVTGFQSEAGYYFMPDFEVIREGLKKSGITTCQQMTEAMLQESDVALLGSHAFLRPTTELSVRFCFNCFNGRYALQDYRNLKNNAVRIDEEEFLQRNCQRLVKGIERLKDFVNKYKNIGLQKE